MHKNFIRKLHIVSGQSLVEVILAIALLAIFASTLSVYLNNQLTYMSRGQSALEAIYLAQEGIEATRSIRDEGWEFLATGTHGLLYEDGSWLFNGSEENVGKFTRQIIVDELEENEMRVTSLVSWPVLATVRSIVLTTNLANWREVVEPLLTGDWQFPQTLGQIDLGPGNAPTDLALKDGIVYISAEASAAAKPDFFIIDATSGQSPVIKSQINTSVGLNAVDVNGNFAFLANKDTANHLQVANISDINNPYIVSSYRLAGNISEASAIAATGTVVLVGTKQDSGPELFIVNVTNPSNPGVITSLEIGGSVNRILLKDDKAFVVTSNDNSELIVIDIANPANPSVINSVDLPNTNDALSVFVNQQDNHLYVSRSASGSTNSPEILIYDANDVTNLVLLGSLEFSNDVPAVFAADDLMFIGSTCSSEEFQVYDISDPSNISYWTGMNFPQLAVDMLLENNVIYMAIRSNDALRIITAQ